MLGGLICLEYSQQLFHPFAHSLTEAFAQVIEDSAITNFGLIVALWVVWHRESIGDVILGIEGGYLLGCEVHPVIGDDSVCEVEASYTVLP